MAGPTAHHELGASGAYRWLVCPGSVAAQRGLPESSSPYAEEGTSAHELGEALLNGWKKETGAIRATQEWREAADAAGYDCKEMIREVEKYTEYVKDFCDGDPSRLSVETEVSFGDLIPGGFGTADATAVKTVDDSVRAIDVGDLKYGKGKTVYAADNPQLRLYAYGVVLKLIADGILDPEFDEFDLIPVRLHICQPRLDHFDSEEVDVEALLDWADTVVRPVVERIRAGDVTRVAGPGCDFCKVAATCKARVEQVAAELDSDFDDLIDDGPETPNPDELTPEQVGALFKHKKSVENYFKTLESHIYGAIERGETVPGFKLVEGNTNRKWEDDEKVLDAFKKQRALKQDEYAPRKLITPPQADKLLPEKSAIRDLIVVGKNRPMLVAETHKKPALVFSDIEDDFDDIDDGS